MSRAEGGYKVEPWTALLHSCICAVVVFRFDCQTAIWIIARESEGVTEEEM